ncbi:tRNA methyltransferase [Penicillium lagena]|uniref:tRNA methyltransferase n=1 Tax=Penicillium lagena TaxID=94218 RepID=UPI002541320D|nr:tRNA methyltransferase [Penicillium lagena]KAJ5601068.1 tRNA methyltransferase [Penicillium lagena]
MAQFQQPFHCLQYVQRQPTDLLIGSAGQRIYSYAAPTGKRLDVWPQNVDSANSASGDQAPPEKRRKLSAEEKSDKPTWSTIPILKVSPDGKHVVAVTAEDKSIRVLQLDDDGTLQQLSSRTMAKRPSALALTPDGKTIICADKFGDAYSLPLIPSTDYVPEVQSEAKPYKPAATSLTVHTKRNLESLEQQKRQAELKAKKVEEKTALAFEHQVILGHVSLLTDLICVPSPTNPSRSYILTADRDEHIRVSRGVPQAHVIEQYCLGHTAFISKLFVPSWAPELLVSGGGDNYLMLWEWTEGRMLQKVPLLDPSEATEVIVRGIWEVSFAQVTGLGDPLRAILVALEGSSQLLCFTLEKEGTLKQQIPIQLSGNVLDLVVIESRKEIAVSVDTVHQQNSTDTWKPSVESPQMLLECLRAENQADGLHWIPSHDPLAGQIASQGTTGLGEALDDKQKKELTGSLYSLGNLRKRSWDE